MSYRHGIYVSEAATDLLTVSRQSSGVTAVIGTAPVHRAKEPAGMEPVLCATYNEAVTKLGYSTETGTWTLCEAMEVLYGQYNVGPIVFINVFDPTKSTHQEDVARSGKTVTKDRTIELTGSNIIPNTIQVETQSSSTVLFDATVTDEGVTLEFGSGVTTGTTLYVSYAEAKPTAVTAVDVVGGVNATTGVSTGLELIGEIYPRFGLTVGQIIAPGWSQETTVALGLAAKAENINGHFSALAISDLNATTVRTWSQAKAAKESGGLSHRQLAVCWPMVSYGGRKQHLSTHMAGLLSKVAQADGDIPYRSPSNQALYIDGMIRADGSNCYFSEIEGNELNGAGIVTVNRQNGWQLWGNRTSIYPAVVDPKDCWIPIRRMFDYVKAALVLNFWSQLDQPITMRQINTLVNSANTYLNGLMSRRAILGGRVVYAAEDNTEEGLMDGRLNFRVYLTPSSPAREINFTLEYDRSYLSTTLGV